ncbi:MAG: hypothetical protein O9321_19175 [Rubrivivax sp.]|jgi:hypothetical protein|nr:hypothetical protein [Rubrivivax sp.]
MTTFLQHPARRRLMLAILGSSALGATGCMTKPIQPARADGTWCYRVGSFRRKAQCSSVPVPSADIDTLAKRFEATADRLTVYVVRKRWGDAVNKVHLEIDGNTRVETLPETFVRLRVTPGLHRIRADWPEGSAETEVQGAAGEIRFVELVGTVWAWGTSYRFEAGLPEKSMERVRSIRLVADVS